MDKLNKRFPIYSKIIGLYPTAYRKEYGRQILQTTADMLDNSASAGSRARIWLKVAVDLPLNIAKQQIQYCGVYMKDTPSYIKAASVISGLMLLPFFIALIANGLDKVINNHTLYGSWVWRTPVLGLWVLYLPLTAFLLAAGSYLMYISRHKKTSWVWQVLDIKHSWPVVLPAVVALGILFMVAFHDSVHCWVQTPTHLLTHVRQAWRCSVNNQSLQAFRKHL